MIVIHHLKQSFESVFIDLDMPFFQILGNHDHLGNASAQIEYTKYSKRWSVSKD